MLKVKVYNQSGTEIKEIELNESVFGIEPHKQSMFDMVLLQRASLRQGTHKTKNRTEVRGGGRKPWRQKGTGRARQGSIRSPQWRGGGVVFGPTPRSYGFKLNRKVRRLALKSALSTKVLEKQVIVLDNLTLNSPKTKDFVGVLNGLNIDKKALFVTNGLEDNLLLSSRNIASVSVVDAKGVNVYDLLNNDYLVITEEAIKTIEEVLS